MIFAQYICMMQQAELRAFQTDQDLRSCGLTPESIQAIRSTTVITRDGAQHVVPESQAHLDESTSVSSSSALNQQIQDVGRMFSRHKQFSDKRLETLERTVSQLQELVKEQQQTILTLRSNQVAQQKQAQREQSLEQVYADEATEETTREIKSTPRVANKPIDRNKVSPADVQVEDIFYSGTRR